MLVSPTPTWSGPYGLMADGQSWSMIGGACVALVTVRIMADIIRYFDHYGYRENPKLAFGLAVGTAAAW
jgi:hypothetical protein